VARRTVEASIDATKSSLLYTDWKDWTSANGLAAGSNKTFTQALADRGYECKHTRNGSQISGLGLRPKG
jgi:putative DNA primase/helicase